MCMSRSLLKDKLLLAEEQMQMDLDAGDQWHLVKTNPSHLLFLAGWLLSDPANPSHQYREKSHS